MWFKPIKTDEEDDPSLDETDATGLENAIAVIKRYENMIKTKKKIINEVGKEGKILKILVFTEPYVENT